MKAKLIAQMEKSTNADFEMYMEEQRQIELAEWLDSYSEEQDDLAMLEGKHAD